MADARAVEELKKRTQHRFQLTVHPYGPLARGRPDVRALDRLTVPGAGGLGVDASVRRDSFDLGAPPTIAPPPLPEPTPIARRTRAGRAAA